MIQAGEKILRTAPADHRDTDMIERQKTWNDIADQLYAFFDVQTTDEQTPDFASVGARFASGKRRIQINAWNSERHNRHRHALILKAALHGS